MSDMLKWSRQTEYTEFGETHKVPADWLRPYQEDGAFQVNSGEATRSRPPAATCGCGCGCVADYCTGDTLPLPSGDMMQQLEELESTFVGNPDFVGSSSALRIESHVTLKVDPSRSIISRGILFKKSRFKDDKYYFFLFNDYLAYASFRPGMYVRDGVCVT